MTEQTNKKQQVSTPLRVPNELLDEVQSYIAYWKSVRKLEGDVDKAMSKFSKDSGVLLKSDTITVKLTV